MVRIRCRQFLFPFLFVLTSFCSGLFGYFVFRAETRHKTEITKNITTNTDPPILLRGLFVRDVFRAKDEELQMFFLRDYRNLVTVELKLDDAWVPFHSHCYYPICNGTFDDCTYMDYFAQVPIPSNFSEEVAVIRLQGSKRERTFKILDVRSDGSYKHELAAVLQPAYYMADWQNLIQFFESWIAHGATKFYIYHYSWTKQVQRVVDFYLKRLGPSSVEVLPWSGVPVLTSEEGQFRSDPNTRMFNLISESSLNNALYRSKKEVKFLALMDLDEIVSVTGEEPLISLLNTWDLTNENAAQFSLDWLHYSTRVPLVSFDKPRDVSFDYLESIHLVSNKSMDEVYFKNRKAIHRPDRVTLVDTHRAIAFENATRFQEILINSNDATVIHLRRVFDSHRQFEVTNEDVLLGEHSRKMAEGYRKRVRGSLFSESQMSPWVAQYESVLLTLHDCRRVTDAGLSISVDAGLTRCRSIRGCEQFLSGKESFIFAQMSWTNLAEPFDILAPLFNELRQKGRTEEPSTEETS